MGLAGVFIRRRLVALFAAVEIMRRRPSLLVQENKPRLSRRSQCFMFFQAAIVLLFVSGCATRDPSLSTKPWGSGATGPQNQNQPSDINTLLGVLDFLVKTAEWQ